MKTLPPLRIVKRSMGGTCSHLPDVVTHISEVDALAYLGADAIEKGEKRFEVESQLPWGVIRSVRGLAVTAEWTEGPTHKVVSAYTLHGVRSLSNPRESGYDMEGRVSINGKSFSAFTSHVMFKLPNGKLIDCAVLHVRGKRHVMMKSAHDLDAGSIADSEDYSTEPFPHVSDRESY